MRPQDAQVRRAVLRAAGHAEWSLPAGRRQEHRPAHGDRSRAQLPIQVEHSYYSAKERRGGRQAFPKQPSFSQAPVASFTRQDLRSPAMLERIDERRERWRLLSPPGIVEMVARERGRPIGKHTDQLTSIHVGSCDVLRHEGHFPPFSAACLMTAMSLTVSCPSTRTAISRDPFSNSQA